MNRFSMKCLALPVTAVALAATPACSTRLTITETVVAEVTRAMGGEQALRNLRNVRIDVAWTEGGRSFTGDYRATRDGRMRIDVYLNGKRVYSEGLDTRGAWEQAGEGAEVVAVGAAARDALRHGISYRFDGIWFARERGHGVEYVGTDAVAGAKFHVMKLKFPEGFETYFLVNPSNWLPERRRDQRAYHPSVDSTKIAIESVDSDYVFRCGVAQALTSRDINLATGEVLAERRVNTALCNLPDSALDIDRP
jgi:hypothetical protein